MVSQFACRVEMELSDRSRLFSDFIFQLAIAIEFKLPLVMTIVYKLGNVSDERKVAS